MTVQSSTLPPGKLRPYRAASAAKGECLSGCRSLVSVEQKEREATAYALTAGTSIVDGGQSKEPDEIRRADARATLLVLAEFEHLLDLSTPYVVAETVRRKDHEIPRSATVRKLAVSLLRMVTWTHFSLASKRSASDGLSMSMPSGFAPSGSLASCLGALKKCV